jgi:hypothetical protein
MPHPLSELWQLLQSNELPSYAREQSSSFVGVFTSKGKAVNDALAPALQAIRFRHGQYAEQQLSKDLHKLFNEQPRVFAWSPEEKAAHHLAYPSLAYPSETVVNTGLEALLQHPPMTGIPYMAFRYIFYLACMGNSVVHHLKEAAIHYPEAYYPELALIALQACKVTGKNLGMENLLLQLRQAASPLEATIRKHLPWLLAYQVSQQELALKAAELFLKANEELHAKWQELPWPEYSQFKLADCAVEPEIAALDSDSILELVKLSIYNPDTKLTQKLNEGYLADLLTQMAWTKAALLEMLDFAKTRRHYTLPKPVLNAAKALLPQHPDLFDALWGYLNHLSRQWQDNPALEKILHEYIAARYPFTGDIAPLPRLWFAGFQPVPPVPTQNVYKGMRPEQMRPFFQLLRAVGDVDIIKFYQDKDKNHWVKFRIQNEQYELKATSGLGVGIITPLNTLLYEHGIPYQLTYLDRSQPQLKAARADYDLNFRLLRVILVNAATYQAHKPSLLQAALAGFAPSPEQPAPAFVQSLEELGKASIRQDLEVIDLKHDPKFSVLRDEAEKLAELEGWTALLTHCLRYPMDGKPSKGWQAAAAQSARQLGEKAFQDGHVLILDKLSAGDEWFADTEKASGLKGLIWLSHLFPGTGQLYLLQKIANRAYKKIPGGPLNAKLGNLALEILAKIGTLEAYGALSNIAAKATYPVYKRAIESCRKKFAKLLEQYSPDELADRSVPDHGLLAGQRRITVEDWHAILSLDGLKVLTIWEAPGGKKQKAAPAALKQQAAGALKAVKAEEKSIVETLQAQARRLERSWLLQRSWVMADWQAYIAGHPLMNVLAERLIWMAEDGTASFILSGGQMLDARQVPVQLPGDTRIRLWHPAIATVAEALAWRDYIFAQRLIQPFKQAFREVYMLTPAEALTSDHSNRFAGHYLRGNTLYSLGKAREWVMSYDQPPIFRLPGGQCTAMLNISGRVLYSDCLTQELCFLADDLSNDYQAGNRQRLRLADIHPVILSEVMRDIDLFVSVASLGLDPLFDQKQTGDLMDYWRDASFGAKSKTPLADVRRDLLQRLLPMTKIADKCNFEGNFLKVAGSLRTYKINLGSGNILMEPNDQYLCIVPGSSEKTRQTVWLPFEGGDETLMVILSKAFLLAADEKITAADILAQILRK